MRHRLTKWVGALFIDRHQRRGLLGLSIVLMTIVGVRMMQAGRQPYREQHLQLAVSERIPDSVHVDFSARNGGMRTFADAKHETAKKTEEAYFSFDPNTLNDSGWIALGLSTAQVKVIRNYQRAGGNFRTPEDVGRIYTLPRGWFERHRQDIRIEQKTAFEIDEDEVDDPKSRTFTKTEVTRVELNSADSATLVAVRGVGPSSAVRILRFREALGGFINKEQLNEVWGLHPNVRDRLLEVSELDSTRITRLDLDTSGVRSLAAHPYISYQIARALVNYRDQHGPFKYVQDIRRSHLVNDSLAARIEPYLYVRSGTQRADTLKHP
jgi:DNA uptake protein ComE-like DNA-binding protein